jgi:hypothetical protein
VTFSDFNTAYQSAKDLLRSFEGDDNWPGLTAHDRVYALPVDWQREEYTAIVRAQCLGDHASSPIPVMVWHWHWQGGREVNLDKLSYVQLAAIADIKRTVRRWIEGKIDDLPPSTCRRIQILKEEPR